MRKILFILLLILGLPIQAPAMQSYGPPLGPDGMVEVKSLAFFIDVQSINSAKQTYTANVFYRFRWHDPRLAHQEDGARLVPLSEIWHPQILVLNRARIFTSMPDVAEIEPDGTVSARQRAWGDFTTPLDMREFPFDEHRFSLSFAASGDGAQKVRMVQDDQAASGLSSVLTLPDWKILSTDSGPAEFSLSEARVESIPVFQVGFTANRDTLYYTYKVIIPLLLLVCVSWLVFWIGIRETSTQISVSITTILTLTAYRFAIGSSVPNVSYMTRMDNLILYATLITFAALALVITISNLRRADREEAARKLQRACRVIFPIALVAGVLKALVI